MGGAADGSPGPFSPGAAALIMVELHPLPVRELHRLTDESFMITFGVPAGLREAYTYRAGQHVAVQTRSDGVVERRSFSICLPPQEAWPTDPTAEGRLAIGVKVLPQGRFSGYVRDRLVIGETLTVLTPTGRFTPREADAEAVRYGGLVAGSGITPLMSIVPDVLHRTGTSSVDLVVGNRTPDRVMFAERLSDWQRRWPDRLRLRHVWSRQSDREGTIRGRLTEPEVGALLREQFEAGVTEWFLCGPQALVTTAQQQLGALGVGRRMIHTELFRIG